MVEDPITWKEVTVVCAGVVAGVVAWVTNKQVARIDDIEKDKADKADFEQHERDDRENFRDLFKAQEETRKIISDGFAQVNHTLSGMHATVLHELGKKADRAELSK